MEAEAARAEAVKGDRRTGPEAERKREARAQIERVGRILSFLQFGTRATKETEADRKLIDEIGRHLKERGEW